MSAGWSEAELLEPIAAEHPCGPPLDEAALLVFDGFRVFGRGMSLDTPAQTDDQRQVAGEKPHVIDWTRVKDTALEALRRSKDLQVLAYFAAAVVRTDGLVAFLESVHVAARWLDEFWEQTYPVLDGDGFVRRGALNCLADPFAVVEPLRRVALVSSRQHGVVSLRALDIAAGQATPAEKEPRLEEAQINAAFASLPLEALQQLTDRVAGSMAALKAVDAKMRAVGSEATPDFDALMAPLKRMEKVLRSQLALRPGEGGAAVQDEGAAVPAQAATFTPGAIRSRDEAIRALDAVAAYFRTHEPSSPVPLLCDRAKGLVSLDFLSVLANIAPDAVRQAREAGGLKD